MKSLALKRFVLITNMLQIPRLFYYFLRWTQGIYLLKTTEFNQKLIGQYISFLEYPDGSVAIMHEGRKINYSIFNKLAGLQQNEVVENKRLGAVLAHIQQHEEMEKQNKHSRAQKSMPSRKAQKAIIEQRNLNPVLDSCC